MMISIDLSGVKLNEKLFKCILLILVDTKYGYSQKQRNTEKGTRTLKIS